MRFVLSADLHLRGNKPLCRIDPDWVESQRLTLVEIVKVANDKKAPLFLAGDIFDTARVATEITVMLIKELKKVAAGVWMLAGNHDLPYHSYKNVDSSSYGILKQSFGEIGSEEFTKEFGKVNANPFGLDDFENECEIAFTHQLVFPNEEARPMIKCGVIAEELSDSFINAKWVFTGDYHTSFVFEKNEKFVINPGCTNIQKADYATYKPSVYFIDTDIEEVEQVFIPSQSEMVSIEYIEITKERDSRIDSFLEVIKEREGVSLSFVDNLQKKLDLGELSEEVKAEAHAIMQTLAEAKEKTNI